MPKKILVVDDEAGITELVASMLRRQGFEVREENSATAALEVARQFRPDLILMDIQMPEISGDNLASQFSEDKDLYQIPIVFITGLVTETETNDLKGTGGRSVLAKPIKQAELVRCIEENLA